MSSILEDSDFYPCVVFGGCFDVAGFFETGEADSVTRAEIVG
jgi:hypothetical protein